LLAYAMCSVFLSYEIGTWECLADEAQLVRLILGLGLTAWAVWMAVPLCLEDLRCDAMIESERRISELIALD
jgi:hypothetical protein